MGDAVEAFYSELGQGEWDRLDTPYSRIEFLTSLSLIDKYFPHSGRALDIGGGPGRYAVELLKRNLRVTLLDLSPKLVTLAGERLKQLSLVAEALCVGDARDLSQFESNSIDAALIMGPLYHLRIRSDRQLVLREARRVLKPGGRALVAYLNCWGLIRTGLIDFPDQYVNPEFVRSMFHEGSLGIWYWSNPDLAKKELTEAGFEVIAYAGAEGFADGMITPINRLAQENAPAYEVVVQAAIDSAEMVPFRDMTNHLHFVVA